MKKPFRLVLGAMIGFGIFTGGAMAAPVEDGGELVTVCKALMANGAQEGSEGARCKMFLVDMVMAQKDTLTLGEPFRARRMGPDEDETVCFQLPDSLPFAEFAHKVTGYSAKHPDITDRPAYELAARALAESYPCSEDELKHDGRKIPGAAAQ
ncbi:MAG: hypothetical protein CVT83_07965 [Alphaproteobacteria bacterium HGW-Alphaproteobacteria-5]|nr:MAG: hypothetical protein CVT83_07965 [Alphaproteobacteria bacterium HGW-Alphaproteobacteria-5]